MFESRTYNLMEGGHDAGKSPFISSVCELLDMGRITLLLLVPEFSSSK